MRTVGWLIALVLLVLTVASMFMNANYTPAALAITGVLVLLLSRYAPPDWPVK